MVEMLGLKKPLPQINSAKAVKKAERSGHRHQQVAGGHEQPAEDHRPARPQQPVGQQPAEERRHVDQRRVGPVDGVASLSP